MIPILMEINFHLEEFKKVPESSKIASVLQTEHKWRFRKYTDPGDPDHE